MRRAFAPSVQAAEAREKGVIAVLAKPYSVSDLEHVLSAA
jgi:hypothetical protein